MVRERPRERAPSARWVWVPGLTPEVGGVDLGQHGCLYAVRAGTRWDLHWLPFRARTARRIAAGVAGAEIEVWADDVVRLAWVAAGREHGWKQPPPRLGRLHDRAVEVGLAARDGTVPRFPAGEYDAAWARIGRLGRRFRGFVRILAPNGDRLWRCRLDSGESRYAYPLPIGALKEVCGG